MFIFLTMMILFLSIAQMVGITVNGGEKMPGRFTRMVLLSGMDII